MEECRNDCPWFNGEFNRCDRNHAEERTCTVLGVEYDKWMDECAYELSCGHWYWVSSAVSPNYCPDCGAKVVEE